MTIAQDFQYYKPKDEQETSKLLSQYPGRAQILAGGTDLVRLLKEKDNAPKPDAIIDIKGIEHLGKIEFDEKDNALHLGALVTFSDLLTANLIKEKFPLLQEMSIQVASLGIRNRATIVGNICSAVPSCDSGPILLVYDADVIVKNSQGERKTSIHDWFLGSRKTALKHDEFVTKIILRPCKEKHAGCYVKLRRYSGEDLAQASIALLASKNEIKVAFGAVAPTPLRSGMIEKALSGKEISDSLIKEVAGLVSQEIFPITDLRATKEYRMHMVKIMLERGLKTITSRLQNNTPHYGTRII